LLNTNIKELCKIKESTLLKRMPKHSNQYYNQKNIITDNKNYIFCKGNIPVMLNAHLDTVHHQPIKEIYHDQDQNVYFSPQGMGGDDRAGIYSILQILESGYKPYVLFTTGEELGGIGARKFIKDFPKNIYKIKYIIALDRKGEGEAVFYDIDSQDFISYILQFGFIEEFGSFSDISIIAPKWRTVACNLSVGYDHAHQKQEIINLNSTHKTIEKVKTMLDESINLKKPFKYKEIKHIPLTYSYYGRYPYNIYYNNKNKKKKSKKEKEKEDYYSKHFPVYNQVYNEEFNCLYCGQIYSLSMESTIYEDICIHCESAMLNGEI